jgi:hypothetical protein
MSRAAARRLLGASIAALLVLTGCASLPESGPVRTRTSTEGGPRDEAPYFTPPGPRAGDSRAEIVSGFLTAMQANPPSTAVARQFLSDTARDTWTPNQGTIVYDAPTLADQGNAVRVRFSDAQRLDARGGWVGGSPGQSANLRLRLVREEGQWRITNPPNALAVPESYFASLFVPFDLYFYDQSGRVLVPDRVYVPAGEQTATNLVRGLLLGPGASLESVTTSAFPSRSLLDLGVVVTAGGMAEVPLGTSILKLSQRELGRAVAQLARTLRQVPGINRLRITVDGAPVPLPGSRTDVSVDVGDDLDPALRVGNPDPVALRNGRAVRVVGDTVAPLGGPLGRPGYALRARAGDDGEQRLAAVTANGRDVFLAPSQGQAGSVRKIVDDGADLRRPAFDMFGTLWVLDRTSSGARIIVAERVRGRMRARTISVPGISGQRDSALTVTGDGTRLIATLAGGANPVVRVSAILRAERGMVERAERARTIQVTGADLGPALDVGLAGPTMVAVLTRPEGASDRVVFLQLDGSPGGSDAEPPDVVPTRARSLVVGPYPRMPLRVVTEDQHLLRLDETGEWVRNRAERVSSAAYPR